MTQPAGPPPHPWVKGTNETYSMISLIVDLCQDNTGRVFSAHRLQEPLDYTTAMSWPGGGQEQVAFGLLVEAARREAVLGLILMLSKDPELLNALKASEARQEELLASMSSAIQAQFARTLQRIAGAVAKEALQATLS